MSALSDYLDKYTKAPYIPEGPAPGINTSDDSQSQDSGSPGLFDKISAFLSNAGQAYASADNPGAEIYSQTPYADNLTNEVHDQNMADGQNIYTVLAPNYTPRPLDDSVYTDIPGTPVDLGTLEDESVRNARMQDSADYMAANWPRLYGAGAGAVENGANVVGGIQNALGLGDSTLQNAEQFEKGMQDYRKQWDATYGDSYFLNPNNFANDAGAVVGSSAPILALSAMTPGALVAGGSRALTGALSRAGLGRLAMSKAGQALIADTVRTLPSSSLADSLSEYGGVVHDLMQKGMSEDEARAQAVPIFYKNMALDTAVLPLELGIAKGGKGLITGLLKRNAGENIGKGLAKGTARTGILSGLSGLTEGYQEGAQNALEDQTKGERDGGWYNPVTWTPEDWKSARAGFVGGALMGIPGNVATAYHPDTKQADLSPEAQTQVQDIKNTLMNDASYGNMDSDTYNSYLELANSGNPELIKLADDSLASWKEKQGISTNSTVSTDMTAGEQTGPVNAEMEAEKDRIRQYLNDNTIDQMGGQGNYDWLYNTLNSTDPDEVHKAYQTVVDSTAETQAQEAAQAEQQAESQPAGNVSINSDNPFIGYVVKAANDQGIDPKIALSIAARETGGDDVNAINMAPNGGLMQVTEESANDYGVNDLYPDWRDDPEQNAEAGMYILKKKIEEQGGDTWAGVRAYNGAGEAADQYLNQIQQNYDNLGDIGGSSWSDGVSGYDLPTQSDEITAQVETLKPGWKQALPAIGGILNDMGLADGSAISSAGRTSEHNAEVGGAEHSYHINDDERGGGDAVDIVLPEGTTEEQAQAVLDRFKSTGAFKEVLFHDAGSGYHLHLGGYTGGLNGMSGNVDSDMSDIRRQQDAEDRAFDEQEREINDDSRAAMNRIMNDNSVENAFDETQRDTEAAKKQQEETLKTLTSDTQEGQPAQTPETAQNHPQGVPDTTVDATAPIEQQTTITGANTATKAAQQNQPVQTSQAQPMQTPAGTQDPRINKAIHDPAMLNLVTRVMNGDSAAKESAGKLNQNIVDAVQQHIIATALNAHQQRIAKEPAGKTETILSDDVKTEYPAQYKIVSADDITPSNNTDGSVNAFYPQQYQPRDRTRAGMRKQVENMANKLNPSALGASSNANMGAPVINSQGVVLNGNGRTMALKSVYKGKPKQIKAYKDFLKQNAKSLGIDPATIDSIKNPVLVRQVADDAPVQDIINSKAGGSQMSAGETAKKDADRIKQSTLQLASDSGDLTQESNRKFVNAVLKDVASPEELNTLYTKTGKISQAGITRVKNAVFAKAYGDDFLLTKMSESTDNNIRNVMNSMLAVAPKVAMLNDGMEKGLFYSYPLSYVISGSAKTLISLREQNKPVKFYLEETSLISENENQNSINDVLRFIDRNKRSGKTITAFFNELCNEIELQGHPDQGALIPTENPTMEEVINIAEGKVENNGVQSLFDTGRSEGNQTDQASGRMADRVLQSPSAGTETNAGTNGSERKEESAGKTESRPEVAKGEANEESTESNHVDTEPQQTESKDKESTHAEEGSQGDVQAKQDVNDATLSIGGKIFQLIERRKPRRYDKKAILHYLKSVYITPYEENGAYYIDIDNFEIEKTIKVSKKDYDYAVKYTKDGKWVGSYYQRQDNKEIKKAAPKDNVQEEVSKFHNVLDNEKSTPKQVIDTYKSVVDKVIANASGSRKNAKIGDKIVTDEYQSLTNSKHWNAFMNEDGGRNWHEVATINADAHKTLRAIIKTAGVKAKEAPSSQGIAPYKQAVDDITDKLAHKKLTPAQAINKLKTIMKDANAARWGEFKAMEAIESKEKLSFDDYKMALDLANDAMKKANDMRLEASRKRKARKTAKELESATEETNPAEQSKEKAGFTDDEINTLTDRGFKRWTKKLPNGKVMDRLYIKPEYLGLELTRYKSGNISSAKFNGETISNSEARRIEGTKCYVDVATKEVVCDREDLKKAAQEVIDDALSKEKSQDAENTHAQLAYHGTPHMFDHFDLTHIGSGYGVQAHGWGLYFAANKNIANAYKEAMEIPEGEKILYLNGKKYTIADSQHLRNVETSEIESDRLINAAGTMVVREGSIEGALKRLHSLANRQKGSNGRGAKMNADSIALLEQRNTKYEAEPSTSGVYAVDIPESNTMLDEQKTISEQPAKVKRAIYNMVYGTEIPTNSTKSILTDKNQPHINKTGTIDLSTLNKMTGKELYSQLANSIQHNQKSVSLLLNKYGIKGITYDGGIDGRCYVVFDDQAIAIQQRYDTALNSHMPELKRSYQTILANIKKAFPNGKIIKEENNKIVLQLPNGSRVYVDIAAQCILTEKEMAKAKKEHGYSQDADVVAQGFERTIGKDGFIQIAENSTDGTEFHEAFHFAKDVALTSREKQALDRANNKQAKAEARSIDEVESDNYAKWRKAREKHRGTAFGRLYNKITDFATRVLEIFKGVDNVHSIFRNIESGEVWNRTPGKGNGQTRYSVREDDTERQETTVKPQDIITAINDIVHIYEGSKLTAKEREELKKASKFDPDHKQADRPQATELYDRRAKAGFNRMGYFNMSNYGRILALHLDNVMGLKGNLELTRKSIERQNKNAAEAKMNGVKEEKLSPSQARQRAVMDFGAMMIRNPELARETYPDYAKIFDEGLANHPDLKEKLDRVIKLNETYQGQTAAQRASGSIAAEKEKTKLRSNPKKWLHEHFTRFYTGWVDDKNIFSQVVARAEAELGHKLAYDYDVHKQAQMALNLASSRSLLFLTGGKDTKITYKVLNTVYGNAITKAVTMKDIMDELNKVSKEDVAKTGADNAYDALGNYLIAMRTEELEKHYHDAYARSAGFDEEGTQEIIKNTPESIRKIAQMYWDINTNVVNILQQQGLISKELAGKLRKYKHYCPMYRDMSDGITDMDEMIASIGMFNNGGGYANINNGIKRIEGGGKRPILDPITSLSQMAVSMISKCERNNVAKTFVKLGQDFAGLGDIVVRDPTLQHADPTAFAFTVWQNGKQVVYRTTPEIYDALTHMDSNSASAVLGIARNIAHTLRTGATISPSFIVRNFLRDTMSATVNSKTGFKPIVDSIRGAWKLHFDKNFSAEYHASGASMSTYMRADADSSRDLTKELLGHKYDSYPVVVKQVRQLIGYAWNKYEKFGNLVEDSTRAGEFMRARKKGMSIDQSGQLARDITLDFSRHGKRGQEFNKYVPFFNATIQGTDKFIRTFKENPMRAILTTTASIILPSLILWAINHDDDWYKELDENTKYTNWCINLGNGAHLLIPKPQEVGILFGSGVEAVLNQLTGTDPHGIKEWAKQYVEAVTPSLYPAVVRPLIEWMTNYSFWTGRHLIPTGLEKAPSEMQFTSYTSELAKSLGDTWLAKSIKLSPIAIDNWISGWFGSAGRFLANMLNDPINYVKGNSRPPEPAKYWYEMPFIGSFIRQNGQNSEYINRMYEIQKEMSDDYERSDAGKQRKGKKGSSNKPKGLQQVNTAVSSVSKINKEIKAIRNDPKKDPDQKRREIDIRREKINTLAKKVVTTFDR